MIICMKKREDIQNLEDIKILVNEFYDSIRKDELLGPIFNSIIKNRWSEHLEKMYSFWQTVLLEEHTYYGSPFPPHAQMPIEKLHFDQWIKLFSNTVDNYFQGEKADKAKWQGSRMADMFLFKIEYYRDKE